MYHIVSLNSYWQSETGAKNSAFIPTLKDGASIAFANRLHPQSENVDCCIEISVHSQATFQAAMDSFREIFFDYHATP